MTSMCVQCFIVALLAICFIKNLNSAPIGCFEHLYLLKYGYTEGSFRSGPNSMSVLDKSAMQGALENFQSFAGLEVEGKLDRHTIRTKTFSRCGIKDIVEPGHTKRSKRQALHEKFKSKNLTYKISKYPKMPNRKDIDAEIQKAFNIWSRYTDLTFTPSKEKVDIDIKFEHAEHGDDDPFDGPGGTVAHAFAPKSGRFVHFDAAEEWTIQSYKGTNLQQVAAHEFGHSLGLNHSCGRKSIMRPIYGGYKPVLDLDTDDIQKIQELYGNKTLKAGNKGADLDLDDKNYNEIRTSRPTSPDFSFSPNASDFSVFK